MPRPRKSLISVTDTPYYHCVSRCVRRSFLCGHDTYSGRSYEHRKQWVEDRIHFLAEVFAIDVCAYAVMSNHCHIVLHINIEESKSWSLQEVIERWHRLYRGTLLSQQFMKAEQRASMREYQIQSVEETAEVWRARLCDISWFMRCLNEHIAREANKEDAVTGRFWEGRFKSQALLDEKALAACLTYVELNPIRAKMADTPEQSDHTSIQCRINAAKSGNSPKRLMPFAGNPRKDMPHGLPFKLDDYIQLVELTGRAMAKNKRGVIASDQPPILSRLGISETQWLELTHKFESNFHCAAGSVNSLTRYKEQHHLRRLKDRTNAQRLLSSA